MHLYDAQVSLAALASTILIRNAQVFDGSYFNVGMVVLEGNYIKEVGYYKDGNHEVHNCGKPCCYGACYDAAGKYLIPGLIDSHSHVFSPDDLVTLRGEGVTTTLDMGMPAGEIFYNTLNSTAYKSGLLPELYVSGSAATGNHSFLRCLPDFQDDALVQTESEVKTFVTDRAMEHTDYLKIVIADGSVAEKMEEGDHCNSTDYIEHGEYGPSVELIQHMVSLANTRDKKKMIFTHATTCESFAMAQKGGVDVITHCPLDGRVNDTVLSNISSAGQITVPSLIKMLQTCGARCPVFPNAQANVKSFYDKGIPILVGTDAQSDMFRQVPMTGSLHKEMLLLVESGMKNIDVLLGATALPAKYFAGFGLGDRGEIKAGKRADLVVLEFNPLANPHDVGNAVSPELMFNIGSVLETWVAGQCFVSPTQGGGNCSALPPPPSF